MMRYCTGLMRVSHCLDTAHPLAVLYCIADDGDGDQDTMFLVGMMMMMIIEPTNGQLPSPLAMDCGLLNPFD